MKKNLRKLAMIGVPLLGMLVSGCSLFGSKKTSISTSDTSEGPFEPVDPVDPGTADDTITGISLKYTKDFYMQIDEVLDFSVTFKGAGSEEQKGIEWISSNPKAVKLDVKEKSYQCVLTALREGSSTIVARSTFDRTLTDSVTITVIDNSDFTYFWQMDKSKSDNKLFNDEDGKTKTDGTVKLNNMDWTFHFDTPDKAVGGGQSLTFGSAEKPYGNVDFSTENTKKIRKVSVLCSSSAVHIDDGSSHGKSGDEGTSRLTVTIGGYKYIDDVATPKYSTDQPLDTVTGEEFNDGSLSGDIKIHFSPTYKDMETKVNSGAIYLKSIIIEYYRGDLETIELDGLYRTDEDEEGHEIQVKNDLYTQFYVGTKFYYEGLRVIAHFSESPSTNVIVDRFAEFIYDNVDRDDVFIEANESQIVTVRYIFEKSSDVTQIQETSYEINVAPRVVKIDFDGSLEVNKFLDADPISYKGINVCIDVEGTEDFKTYPLGDYEENYFKDLFVTSGIHKYASKNLQTNGFAVGVIHKASNLNGSLSFAKDDLIVKEVAEIQITYKDGETPYEVEFVDGQVIDYKDFNAKIIFDNEEEETYPFSELAKQKYPIPGSTKTGYRYVYTSYSPLIAEKSMETDGYAIQVTATLNNVYGKLDIPANQVKVKTISKIELKGALETTEYFEFDDVDYTGLTFELTYDEDEPTSYSFAEMLELKTNEVYINTSGNYATREVPLFEVTAPKEATKDLATNGFTIKVKHTRSDLQTELEIPAETLTVKEYVAKTYTRVTDASQLVADGKYIIAHILDDNLSVLKVWNGALDKEHLFTNNNVVSYTHTGVIGESLEINNSAVEKAYFTFSSSTVGETTKYTVIHQSGAKLSITKSGASLSTKTVIGLNISFDDQGSAKIIAIPDKNDWQKRIYYYTTGEKIYAYNIPAGADEYGLDNTHRAVYIYRVGE
jgi:hypothetical protein